MTVSSMIPIKCSEQFFSGGEDPNLEFTMGPDTSVAGSCSATLNGEFYVFGGHGSFIRQVFFCFIALKIIKMLQISKINGCSLERIAQLPHDFEYGACGTFLFPEPRVMFCFAESDRKKCFR